MSVVKVELRIVRTVSWAIALVCLSAGLAVAESPLDLFDQRIRPIFRSPNPSSCVQCHLSSVDLKNYILPSSDATFVSLRDQGLIDLNNPEKSKVLTLIRMGDRDLDEGARLIHEKTRVAELEAFSAWIEACCADSRLRSLPASTELARPPVADEVIRHARKSRVVDSFVRNVWSQRMRCFPCHTPHEIDEDNPKHQAAIKTRNKFRETYGEEMLSRLEIFRETPEETLSYLIKSSQSTPTDRLPMLDLQDPTNSLLVLKPMSKLPKKREDGTFEDPTYVLPDLSHLGGLKLHKNDQSYKSVVMWIQDYANVVDGKYQSVDELPADNWHPSKLVVRVKAAPEAWKPMDIVQLFVFDRSESDDAWNPEPIAFTQGMVTPRRMVNGALFLLGNDRGEIPELKKGGRYLVRAYRDADGKIHDSPSLILGGKDAAGEAELSRPKWREGFRFAEVISGADLMAGKSEE